jgi:hypothetical protein
MNTTHISWWMLRGIALGAVAITLLTVSSGHQGGVDESGKEFAVGVDVSFVILHFLRGLTNQLCNFSIWQFCNSQLTNDCFQARINSPSRLDFNRIFK